MRLAWQRCRQLLDTVMTYTIERKLKTAGREWTKSEFDEQYKTNRKNIETESKASCRDGLKEGQDERWRE